MILALTANDALLWTGLITALFAAFASAAVAIIGALKGQAAQSQSAATSARVEAQSNSLRTLRQDVTTIALNTPAGNGTGSGMTMPAPTPQIERQAAPQPVPVLTAEEAAFVRGALLAARRRQAEGDVGGRQAEGVVGGNVTGEQA